MFKRHRAVSIGAALALAYAALLVAAMVIWPRGPMPDPAAQARDTHLQKILAELQQGRLVQLIGDAGGPKWHYILAGAGSFTDDAQPFAASSVEPYVIKLLPDPQCDHYRLQAEIQLGSIFSEHCYAGLFFGQRPRPTPGGDEPWFCSLRFNDRRTDDSWVRLYGSLLGPGQKSRYLHDYESQSWLSFSGKKNQSTWRKLAVEVSPERVLASWDGQVLRGLSRAGIDRLDRGLFEDNFPGVDPNDYPGVPFTSRGSLGLVVCQAAASFRNVALIPLH